MGVDDRLFSRDGVSDAARQSMVRPSTRFTIVNIVSCFGEEKGIETVIKSLHKLKSMGLYPILRVIGGDDYIDRRRETALKSLASQLGVGNSVEFVGRQPHETIPDYLASADVLVDGRSVESFSSTLLEALFSRVPVVASDTAENRRILGNGRYGTLFRAGDEDCLAAALRDVLSTPAMGEHFRKQYSEWTATQSVQYSADGMAKATSEVYRKVLSRHSLVSKNKRPEETCGH
jgi:glycosyltransferase involved in cell wall biosynthesis